MYQSGNGRSILINAQSIKYKQLMCPETKFISSIRNKFMMDDDNCPLDRQRLGHMSWSFLHTMAAYYPKHPSREDQEDMLAFIELLAKFYPCPVCARHFQQEIRQMPPDVSSQAALVHWFCKVHNRVNKRLGKPIFDCSAVWQRWKYGWDDGSCNY